MSWALEELGDAELGDVRRTRRLVKIVEDLAASPESSVPLASRDRAALQGMYAFWSNRRIRAEDILGAHVGSTVERSDSRGMVLAIQDTTELNYSGHHNKQGLGYLRGAGTQGLLLHSVLGVSAQGTPLGVLHHQLWARQGRGTQGQRRRIGEKESGRWIESLQRTEELLGRYTHILTIADREADFYDLLACARRPHSDYLIRIRHDRQVKVNPADASQSVQQLLYNTPAAGYLRLDLQRTPRRARGEVFLKVNWVSVWLQPPLEQPQSKELAPVRVQVLWATEVDGDNDGPPVDWMLVTSLPIGCFEDAQCLLQWYSYRWLIERYHYVLKSGCRVEHLQLETMERLQRAVATYAIVAWRLLWLTYLARPLANPDFELEAEEVLQTAEWQALCRHYRVPFWAMGAPPGLQQCIRWIAQLGGFLGRKGDGEPGAKTIWRGLRRLRDLVSGAAVFPLELVAAM